MRTSPFNRVAFGAVLADVGARQGRMRLAPGLNVEFLRVASRGGPCPRSVLGALVLFMLLRHEPRVRPAARLAAGVALAFPVLFYGLTAHQERLVLLQLVLVSPAGGAARGVRALLGGRHPRHPQSRACRRAPSSPRSWR